MASSRKRPIPLFSSTGVSLLMDTGWYKMDLSGLEVGVISKFSRLDPDEASAMVIPSSQFFIVFVCVGYPTEETVIELVLLQSILKMPSTSVVVPFLPK